MPVQTRSQSKKEKNQKISTNGSNNEDEDERSNDATTAIVTSNQSHPDICIICMDSLRNDACMIKVYFEKPASSCPHKYHIWCLQGL